MTIIYVCDTYKSTSVSLIRVNLVTFAGVAAKGYDTKFCKCFFVLSSSLHRSCLKVTVH